MYQGIIISLLFILNMMIASPVLQSFAFGSHLLSVFVPHTAAVKEQYLRVGNENLPPRFPYWSQVWPAAVGLCQFLVENTDYLKNKKVMELAAGLGLPSLLAAQYADNVYASDYVTDAVELMQRSAKYNGIANMQCDVLDWSELPATLPADTLLLSDINYDPASFDVVYSLLQRFLDNKTTIILCTPQRLLAKPFVDMILPFCIKKQELLVEQTKKQIAVTVFVLRK
jgi:predicted nicotinamide N-methyase